VAAGREKSSRSTQQIYMEPTQRRNRRVCCFEDVA
jgi:hypothetical protein